MTDCAFFYRCTYSPVGFERSVRDDSTDDRRSKQTTIICHVDVYLNDFVQLWVRIAIVIFSTCSTSERTHLNSEDGRVVSIMVTLNVMNTCLNHLNEQYALYWQFDSCLSWKNHGNTKSIECCQDGYWIGCLSNLTWWCKQCLILKLALKTLCGSELSKLFWMDITNLLVQPTSSLWNYSNKSIFIR